MHLPAVSVLGITLFSARCAEPAQSSLALAPVRTAQAIVRVDPPKPSPALYQLQFTLVSVPERGKPRQSSYSMTAQEGLRSSQAFRYDEGAGRTLDELFVLTQCTLTPTGTPGWLRLEHDVQWTLPARLGGREMMSTGSTVISARQPSTLAIFERPDGRGQSALTVKLTPL